jgi:hypothetical protein
MNKAEAPPRWYAPWRSAAVLHDDPADLGTAFGLDLSLADSEDADGTTAAGPRRAGWMQRWKARRQTSA